MPHFPPFKSARLAAWKLFCPSALPDSRRRAPAGKTTLLRHLLQNAEGLKIGCIINDVAAVNVDAKLVRNDRTRGDGEAKADSTSDLTDTVELANGCACATPDPRPLIVRWPRSRLRAGLARPERCLGRCCFGRLHSTEVRRGFGCALLTRGRARRHRLQHPDQRIAKGPVRPPLDRLPAQFC